MKYSFTIFFLFFFLVVGLSQNQHKLKNEPCGTDRGDNTALSQKGKEIEEQTQEFIRKGGAKSLKFSSSGVIYTIPVVVHIIYNTQNQNLSNEIVQSQIGVLNEDFQELNTDINLVEEVWKPFIANCQIQFCLATIDPNGNSTTGVIHKVTNVTSFTDRGIRKDDVKRSSKGGDDPWPTNQYLNIWVCELENDVLGYAWRPDQNKDPSVDGVVVTWFLFGRNDTQDGRACTHEVGHWLNLRHLWSNLDKTCGSDKVNDTPTQYTDNADACPDFPHPSCSNGPNGDMFMDFMDYSNCRYFFTNGQKDRMWATLQPSGAHYSVTVSGKCYTPLIAKMTSYEYWFDNDYASKISLTTTNAETYNLSRNLGTTMLLPGLHNFHIRFKDDQNRWSSITSQFITKFPPYGNKNKIIAYEYWFDDIYLGKVYQAISPKQNYKLLTGLNATFLNQGLHSFHIRFKDAGGIWSEVTTQFFFYTPSSGASEINKYEYWFDNDYTQKVSQTVSLSVAIYTLNTTIAASSLTNGTHVFHIRFRQNNNLWSSVLSQNFSKKNSLVADLKMPSTDDLQFTDNNPIFIYPNPNNGKFIISVDDNIAVTNIIIENNSGQTVYRINNTIKSTLWEVDLRDKAQGVYYVEAFQGDKKFVTKVIIEK